MNAASIPKPSDGNPSRSRWRVAQGESTSEAAQAFRELADNYWYCVYAWWRRRGCDDASTVTVSCFTRWLSQYPPASTDTGSGRFREWLRARLEEVKLPLPPAPVPAIEIAPEWAATRYAHEPAGPADQIFQRRWALTVLEFTTETLQSEYASRGEQRLYAEVAPFAGFEGGDEVRYENLASRMGLTVGAAHKAVFDFRSRHRELLRGFVADTILDPAEIDQELTTLLCNCDLPGTSEEAAPLPTAIRQFNPEELLARAMHSVRMTSGGVGLWTPPTDSEVARLFPQYEMLGIIGRGGMGAVYQARQVALDRCVAIKLLPLEISVDREFADRFVREARAMAKLSHPNIVSVYDFGTTHEGHLYFVMEFIEGKNLAEIIHGSGIEPGRALEIVEQVCTALAYAHGKRVIHRDVKPANVMVDTDGQVKVADFGLARLMDSPPDLSSHTTTGTVMGTPDYMAPEQLRGMNVDHRADIYSLGVMLYEMLCREVPRGIFETPSRRINCHPRIDQIVIKAMQQSPDRRYQTTMEMKADVSATRAQALFASTAPTQKIQPTFVPPPPIAAAKVAVMLPVAPPEVAPKNSRSKLQVIGAAALVLATGAYFLSRPPGKNLTAEEIENYKDSIPPLITTYESGAIPLWNTAEAVPKGPGVGWDGSALKIAGQHVSFENVPSHDIVLRASIRSGMDRKPLQMQVRSGAGSSYRLELTPANRTLALVAVSPGKSETLQSWNLPPSYKPDAYAAVELRAVGDQFTVRWDNQVLGSITDSRVSQPGIVRLEAEGEGYFRDIVYVPLDKPLPAIDTGAIMLWDSPEKVPADTEGVSWREDALCITNGGAIRATQISRNLIVRTMVRLNLDAQSLQLAVRNSGPAEHSRKYQLQLTPATRAIVFRMEDGGGGQTLGRWTLPTPKNGGSWLPIELRAIAGNFTILADGEVLGNVHDETIREAGQLVLSAISNGYFRDIVYVPLDD